MQVEYPEIILASASLARASILGNAGVRFHQRASSLDEKSEHELLSGRTSAQDAALYLAKRKAEIISELEPGAIIIGADQTLALDDEILQKPRTQAEARLQLQKLRGRSHQLHSAAVVLHRGGVKPFCDTANLTMRDFSDEFLDWYLDNASESVFTSVGAYHFEGLGIHLFSEIDGDYFTILGLPVVPILEELRQLNILLT